MKIFILLTLILGALQAAALGVGGIDSLVGHYQLERAAKGKCPHKIEIRLVRNALVTSGITLGFYTVGEREAETVTFVSAIDQGWIRVQQVSPSTGQLKTQWQEASSFSYPSRFEVRQLISPSSIKSEIDRGEYFQALLYRSFLEINQGQFVKRDEYLLEFRPRQICRYNR